MKRYENPLTVGDKLYFDGDPIQWVNPSTRKVIETMKRGKFIITAITSKFYYLKSDRKNATTEHKISRFEIDNKVKVIEFSDLTCTAGLIFMRLSCPTWILYDANFEKTLASAKKFNRG